MSKKFPCPYCGDPAEVGANFFPFCSERCKLTDLGKWASGTYAIAAVESEYDESDSESDS
jgi:endogenous inhibitor of DNA gyrase (YacG/DUF329 family)